MFVKSVAKRFPHYFECLLGVAKRFPHYFECLLRVLVSGFHIILSVC